MVARKTQHDDNSFFAGGGVEEIWSSILLFQMGCPILYGHFQKNSKFYIYPKTHRH